MKVDPEDIDRLENEGGPIPDARVEVSVDPRVLEALEEFNSNAEIGRDERGRFIRNDSTQVQLIQELGRAIVYLATGDRDTATDIALAVIGAADQADAGQREGG